MNTNFVHTHCTSTSHCLAVALFLCALSLCNLAAAEKGIVPGDIPALLRPDAKHLNEESLQIAMQASLRAGAMLLIEELLDPGNESKLIYPPHAAIKKTGEKVVVRRFRKGKSPIYEKKRVTKLMPKRDEYGGITGYEKRTVEIRASDRIIGYRDVEISDPEGPIERNITVGIYDRSNNMMPRGWFGMNAQGILILTRCGLGNSSQVREAASELERLMNMFGMPDTTWDQAWVAMAWMALADIDDARIGRRDRLIGKLIDGALTSGGSRNPAAGLWGPVSINHEAQAHLFRVELQLQELFQETEAALEVASKNRRKKIAEEFKKVSAALGEVKRATRNISQQGKRLSEIERPWKMDETNKAAGITHYIYNRDITDIDSTALAAMVLNAAHKRNIIPEVTPRDTIQGKTLVRGLKSEEIIEAAYKSLFNLAGDAGSFSSSTNIFPISDYDKIPDLAGVPLSIKLPPLLSPETWHSNCSAFTAIHLLEPLVSERSKDKIRDRDVTIDNNQKRILQIIDALLVHEIHHKDWIGPHNGEADSLKKLLAQKGWPQDKPKKKRAAAPDINTLSVGYARTPRALLEHVMHLYSQDTNPEVASATRRLAYRLLLEQELDGSWQSDSALRYNAPGVSSGEYAYLITKLAQRHLWQASSDKKNKLKDALNEDFQREGPWPMRYGKKLRPFKDIYSVVFQGDGNTPHRWGYGDASYFSANKQIAQTLAVLLYLSEGVDEAPEISTKDILAVLARSQAAAEAHEQALIDAQDAELSETFTEEKRDKAALELEKAGPSMLRSEKGQREMLHDVWRHILIANSMEDRLSLLEKEEEAEIVDQEAADTEETDEADDQESDEENTDADTDTKSALDNILGGGDE